MKFYWGDLQMEEGQTTAYQCWINQLDAFKDIVNCFTHPSQSLQDTNIKFHSEVVRQIDCIHSLFNELFGVWCGQ